MTKIPPSVSTPPTIVISMNTPGLENRTSPEKDSVNLVKQAIELAKDGDLSADDLAKLKATALSDHETTAAEALFLSSLEQDPVKFAKTVTDAVNKGKKAFDPATVKWSMSDTLKLKSAKGEISMAFKPERINGLAATASSETSGGSPSTASAKASQDRLRMDYFFTADKKPDFEAQKSWQKIDKFDLKAVRSFMDSRNLAPDKKAAFVQDYLNGYYAHTGQGASWGGNTNIQELLPLLPVDEAHRKYIDCETFTAITQTMLTNVTPYVADGNGTEGGNSRNHQVSVVRIDNQGFVQSNHKLQPIPNAAKMTDEEMILAYTDSKQEHTLSRPSLDTSGPMISGSEIWDMGEKITIPDSNQEMHDLTIIGKPDAFTVEGIDENQKHFLVEIESRTVKPL